MQHCSAVALPMCKELHCSSSVQPSASFTALSKQYICINNTYICTAMFVVCICLECLMCGACIHIIMYIRHTYVYVKREQDLSHCSNCRTLKDHPNSHTYRLHKHCLVTGHLDLVCSPIAGPETAPQGRSGAPQRSALQHQR